MRQLAIRGHRGVPRHQRATTTALVLATLALGMLSAAPVRAQTAQIVVTVHDSATLAPLSGVKISVDGRPIDTTDAGGRTRATGFAPGRYTVSANRLGFATANISVTLAAGDSTNVSLAMHVTARTLPGVRSSAPSVDPRLEGFMKRMAEGAGYFFTRGKIDSSHTHSLDQLLRADAPVNLVPGGAGLVFLASHGANLNAFSATTPCWVQIFLDGVLIYNPSMDGSPQGQQDVANLRGYLSSQLEAVEYYPSPASTPVQFREGTPACGTLVLWSRMH